ncbi:MAG: hypothetical protein DRQ48_09670 [Gammaproteobacteria bacterium]|nr:MAG: hypothetical protein DRQ48_09670 [Gammaproteobacteria bacterium]
MRILFLCLLVSAVSHAEVKLPPLHHVVDVDVPDSMAIPEKFPLNKKGQIDCKTCHGVKDIEEIPFDEIDRDANDFFKQGPYPKLTDLCYQCHDREVNKRENIHQLLDDKGELKKQKCKFCHVETPDLDKEYVREDFEFRLPPQKLCLGCHLKTPHLNANNHLLEVDDDMLERIKKYELEHQVHLPLNGKSITCISCHAVHEKGVLDIHKAEGKQVQDRSLEQGIGYEKHAWNSVVQEDKKSRLETLAEHSGKEIDLSYQRIRYEVLLRLPAKDGTLCLVCHKFDL